MSRGFLSPGFLLPQIQTPPLFKLSGHIGLTPALHCHNLKSDKQQQLFPGSLSGLNGDWSLPPPFPGASASLFTVLSLLPFPFFDSTIRDHYPSLDPPSNTGLQVWKVLPLIQVSLLSYCGCPTVDHRGTDWARDSLCPPTGWTHLLFSGDD
jgi:hypothetical protein